MHDFTQSVYQNSQSVIASTAVTMTTLKDLTIISHEVTNKLDGRGSNEVMGHGDNYDNASNNYRQLKQEAIGENGFRPQRIVKPAFKHYLSSDEYSKEIYDYIRQKESHNKEIDDYIKQKEGHNKDIDDFIKQEEECDKTINRYCKQIDGYNKQADIGKSTEDCNNKINNCNESSGQPNLNFCLPQEETALSASTYLLLEPDASVYKFLVHRMNKCSYKFLNPENRNAYNSLGQTAYKTINNAFASHLADDSAMTELGMNDRITSEVVDQQRQALQQDQRQTLIASALAVPSKASLIGTQFYWDQANVSFDQSFADSNHNRSVTVGLNLKPADKSVCLEGELDEQAYSIIPFDEVKDTLAADRENSVSNASTCGSEVDLIYVCILNTRT